MPTNERTDSKPTIMTPASSNRSAVADCGGAATVNTGGSTEYWDDDTIPSVYHHPQKPSKRQKKAKNHTSDNQIEGTGKPPKHRASSSSHKRKKTTNNNKKILEERVSLELELHEDEEALSELLNNANSNNKNKKKRSNTPGMCTCGCKPPSPNSKTGHVELFLPKRLPCTCGSAQINQAGKVEKIDYSKIESNNDVLLKEILRPWQVRFLGDMFHISKASQLIGLYDNVKTKLIAKIMIKWLKKNNITIPVPSTYKQTLGDPHFDVKEANKTACKTAVHIWTKSCKTVLNAHIQMNRNQQAQSEITPITNYKKMQESGTNTADRTTSMGSRSSLSSFNDYENDEIIEDRNEKNEKQEESEMVMVVADASTKEGKDGEDNDGDDDELDHIIKDEVDDVFDHVWDESGVTGIEGTTTITPSTCGGGGVEADESATPEADDTTKVIKATATGSTADSSSSTTGHDDNAIEEDPAEEKEETFDDAQEHAAGIAAATTVSEYNKCIEDAFLMHDDKNTTRNEGVVVSQEEEEGEQEDEKEEEELIHDISMAIDDEEKEHHQHNQQQQHAHDGGGGGGGAVVAAAAAAAAATAMILKDKDDDKNDNDDDAEKIQPRSEEEEEEINKDDSFHSSTSHADDELFLGDAGAHSFDNNEPSSSPVVNNNITNHRAIIGDGGAITATVAVTTTAAAAAIAGGATVILDDKDDDEDDDQSIKDISQEEEETDTTTSAAAVNTSDATLLAVDTSLAVSSVTDEDNNDNWLNDTSYGAITPQSLAGINNSFSENLLSSSSKDDNNNNVNVVTPQTSITDDDDDASNDEQEEENNNMMDVGTTTAIVATTLTAAAAAGKEESSSNKGNQDGGEEVEESSSSDSNNKGNQDGGEEVGRKLNLFTDQIKKQQKEIKLPQEEEEDNKALDNTNVAAVAGAAGTAAASAVAATGGKVLIDVSNKDIQHQKEKTIKTENEMSIATTNEEKTSKTNLAVGTAAAAVVVAATASKSKEDLVDENNKEREETAKLQTTTENDLATTNKADGNIAVAGAVAPDATPPPPPPAEAARPRIYEKLQKFENRRRFSYLTNLQKYKTEWKAACLLMKEGMNETMRAERMALATCIANDAYAEAMQAIYEDVYLDDAGNTVSTESLSGAWKQNRLQAKRNSEDYNTVLSTEAELKGGLLGSLIDTQSHLAEQFKDNAADFHTEVQEELTAFKEKLQKKVDGVNLAHGDALISKLEMVEGRIQDAWRKFCFRLSYSLFGVGVAISTNEQNKPIVSGVQPNSPAAIAGLKANDIFIDVGGTSFSDGKAKPSDVAKLLRLTETTRRIVVVVERNGNVLDLVVSREPDSSDNASDTAGVGVALSTNKDGKCIVSEVEAGSEADDAGIKPNDIIKEIDGTRCDDGKVSPNDAASKLCGAEGSKVKVVMEREGKTIRYVLIREQVMLPAIKQQGSSSPKSVTSVSSGGSTSTAPRNLATGKSPASDTWLLEMNYRHAVEIQEVVWAEVLPQLLLSTASIIDIETDRRKEMPSSLLKFVPRQLPNCNFVHRSCLEKIADRYLDQDVENDINNIIQKQQKIRQKASTKHTSSILNRSRRDLRVTDDLSIDIPPLEADLVKDFFVTTTILERQTKPKTTYGQARWQKSLAVLTADLFIHYFDVPESVEGSTIPNNEIFDMLKPSLSKRYPTLETIDDGWDATNKNLLKDITPVESSYIPSCTVATVVDDSCSFEISEDITGMFGKATTRKFLLRAGTQEERDEWIKTFFGNNHLLPAQQISPSNIGRRSLTDHLPSGASMSPKRRSATTPQSDGSPSSTSSSPFKGWRRFGDSVTPTKESRSYHGPASVATDTSKGQSADDSSKPTERVWTTSPKHGSPFKGWNSPKDSESRDQGSTTEKDLTQQEQASGEIIRLPSL